MKYTKITASIGPNSATKTVIKKMIAAGANVLRLNFSHDTGAAQGRKIDAARAAAHDLNTNIAIMIDLQGPKHRIGDFDTDEKIAIKPGQKFTFDNNPAPGNATRVYLPDSDVMASLNVGDRILLNDGKIEMRVDNVQDGAIDCTVVRGTEIWSRRGFNLPDTDVATGALTDKDMHDLEYALRKNPDFVAVSFVQRADDIAAVRDFITARTAHPVKIIAKIERPNAVARMAEIIDAADGVMIARGDLAVETPFESVPAISRRIIRECRRRNRPVIMATQMLGSMVDSEFPTRAEISDVANAAYLRADATMTSEETTIGINPVHTIETMARILGAADADAIENPYDWVRGDEVPENDWSRSIASMAYLNRAAAIVVFARDADATTQISCRKPDVPIIAVCREDVIANQLCLSRGVCPFVDEDIFARRDGFAAARRMGVTSGHVVIVDGDKVSLRTLE